MRTIQRYAQLFWAVAILLLVGGQLAHAYSDYREITGQTRHSDSDHQHSDSGEDTSTSHHDGNHSHSPINVAIWEFAQLITPHFHSGKLSVAGDSIPEPPVQEIDYPPQLS